MSVDVRRVVGRLSLSWSLATPDIAVTRPARCTRSTTWFGGPVPPQPPIIINVPPSGGPAWWVTALTALLSAAIVAWLTSFVTRSREHQRWLWEHRVDFYGRVIRFLWEDTTEWDIHSKQRSTGYAHDRLTKLETAFGYYTDAELFASQKFSTAVARYMWCDRDATDEARELIAKGQDPADLPLQPPKWHPASQAREALRAQAAHEIRTPPTVLSSLQDLRHRRKVGRSIDSQHARILNYTGPG